MLCRYSGEIADAAYVRSLNAALAQSRNEVESLSIRLSKAEQQVGITIVKMIQLNSSSSKVFI